MIKIICGPKGSGKTKRIIDKANEVLQAEFPELHINLCVPDERTKRHGQAVAAASLPKIG